MFKYLFDSLIMYYEGVLSGLGKKIKLKIEIREELIFVKQIYIGFDL